MHIFQNGNIISVPNWYRREAHIMQLILFNLRKQEKKVTQKQIADYLGISTSSYRDKEKGRREFTQDEMFALSKYFQKPIDEIFLPRDYHFGTDTEKV